MLETMEKLKEAGELIVVERQVDPKHELAAVTRAAQRKSNSAVLFRNVAGTSFPVLSNLYCGRARMCSFIGAEDKAFCQRWNTLLDTAVSPTVPVTTTVAIPEDLVHGRLGEMPLTPVRYGNLQTLPNPTAHPIAARANDVLDEGV